MEKFSRIVEQNDIEKELSGKNETLKKSLLKTIEWNSKDELLKILDENIKAFNNEIPVNIKDLSNIDLIFDFWQSNYADIDTCLDATDWFNKIPKELGITSIRQYCIESTKYALSQICKQILSDLSK